MGTGDGLDGMGAQAGTRNIRLVLAYDGTPYIGWQVQPQGPTVQSVLQDALRLITGHETAVKGSGRTDAGVHALAQVANFRTGSPMRTESFVPALNSVLPPTIAVMSADEVDDAFDAQFSAVEKTYRYRIVNSKTKSPFEHHRSWHINTILDIESMASSCTHLIGQHDFSSFRASGCVATNPVRNLSGCSMCISGDVLTLELTANGFLRQMVRNIVGTLVEIGRGRFSTGDVAGILAARDRTRAGVAAPPHGLYLVRVGYPGLTPAGHPPPGSGCGVVPQ